METFVTSSFVVGTLGAGCGLALKLYRLYVTQPEGSIKALLRDSTFWILALAMVLASGGVAWGLVGEWSSHRAPSFIVGAGAYLILRDAIKTFRDQSARSRVAKTQGTASKKAIADAIP